MRTYAAIDVANYIVAKCIHHKHPINNLQLQSILYYIQLATIEAGYLAFHDDIEAWNFGPVVRKVYNAYCGYGAMPIQAQIHGTVIEPEEAEIWNPIIERKSQLSPFAMDEDVRKKVGPWDTTWDDGRGDHKIIEVSLLQKAVGFARPW